jgi:polar amino acid transport system substrate-binding protein
MAAIASPGWSRRIWLGAAFAAALAATGCATGPTTKAPAEAVAALAPTGTLRIAVYPGSPTSLVERAPPEAMRGVSVDLGRALAQRLGVPAQVMVHARLAEALAAVQRGEADFTITNATAERARVVDFAPTLVDLELGLLVPPQTRVKAVEQMDQAGATLGVSQGSTSERVLGGRLKQTRVRSFPNLDAARSALLAGEIDAFATNKAILFELAERAPGTRVLDGRWGTEHLAPAVPKGRAAGLAYLKAFTDEVRANGEFDRAARRAGLRGTAPPAP